MKWPRFGLRAKILTTHLLVVATSTVALLVMILLVFSIFAPLPLGSDQMLWVLGFVVHYRARRCGGSGAVQPLVG